jgi:hypothetical protein
LQVIKLSIHPSSVGIEAGSVAGDNLAGSGFTSSILTSMAGYVVVGFEGLFGGDGGELITTKRARCRIPRQGWMVYNRKSRKGFVGCVEQENCD